MSMSDDGAVSAAEGRAPPLAQMKGWDEGPETRTGGRGTRDSDEGEASSETRSAGPERQGTALVALAPFDVPGRASRVYAQPGLSRLSGGTGRPCLS